MTIKNTNIIQTVQKAKYNIYYLIKQTQSLNKCNYFVTGLLQQFIMTVSKLLTNQFVSLKFAINLCFVMLKYQYINEQFKSNSKIYISYTNSTINSYMGIFIRGQITINSNRNDENILPYLIDYSQYKYNFNPFKITKKTNSVHLRDIERYDVINYIVKNIINGKKWRPIYYVSDRVLVIAKCTRPTELFFINSEVRELTSKQLQEIFLEEQTKNEQKHRCTFKERPQEFMEKSVRINKEINKKIDRELLYMNLKLYEKTSTILSDKISETLKNIAKSCYCTLDEKDFYDLAYSKYINNDNINIYYELKISSKEKQNTVLNI